LQGAYNVCRLLLLLLLLLPRQHAIKSDIEFCYALRSSVRFAVVVVVAKAVGVALLLCGSYLI